MGCDLSCCLQNCLWIPLIHYIRIARRTRRDLHSKFEIDSLNAHNELRQNHGVKPLTLSSRLSKTCKAHADWLAENDLFEHSEQKERRYQLGICGENLAEYIVWNEEYQSPDGTKCIYDWYREGIDYKYDGRFDRNAGMNSEQVHIGYSSKVASLSALTIGSRKKRGEL